MKVLEKGENTVKVSVDVTNTSDIKADERAQLYAKFTDSRTVTPHFQLCGISAVTLEAGEKKTVTFDVDKYWLSAVLEDGKRVTPDGKITLYAGGHQPDKRSNELSGYECESVEL